MDAVSVTDFPIRDHKVILKLRRRRWKDKQTGKSFVERISVTENGIRYSKEFAAFLKETYGDIPSDLSYAWGFLSYQWPSFWETIQEGTKRLPPMGSVGPRRRMVVVWRKHWAASCHKRIFPFNGELYTFITNRDARTRHQSLVALVTGTKSEDVVSVLERIDENRRSMVEEVTLDLSDSMRKIVRRAFPNASRVIDRFHIQKLACEAVQELRIKHRWKPYKSQMKRWKMPSLTESHTGHFASGTGIRVRNYWHVQGICFSSPQTNGAQVKTTGWNSIWRISWH